MVTLAAVVRSSRAIMARHCLDLAVRGVADAYDLKVAEVIEQASQRWQRNEEIRVAIYMMHTALGQTECDIAEALGINRFQVRRWCEWVEQRREQSAFDRWLDEIELSLLPNREATS